MSSCAERVLTFHCVILRACELFDSATLGWRDGVVTRVGPGIVWRLLVYLTGRALPSHHPISWRPKCIRLYANAHHSATHRALDSPRTVSCTRPRWVFRSAFTVSL